MGQIKNMGNPKKIARQNKWIFSFLVTSFVLAMTVSPLYTSNQNSYFYHGLANAGFGYLNADSFYNTADSTRLFSLVVEILMKLHLEPSFYLLHACLLGLYFKVSFSISQQISGVAKSVGNKLLIGLVLIGIHSAAFGFVSETAFEINLSTLLYWGVAEQYLINPELQPSSFGVFCLLSIFLYTKKRIKTSIAILVLSGYLHASLLIVGLLIALAFSSHEIWRKKSNKTAILILVTFALLTMPALAWNYLVFKPENQEYLEVSREILINFRMPHHALISHWFGIDTVIKIALSVLAAYLSRKNVYGFILFSLLLMTIVLTFIQFISGNSTLALIFPWRVSVVIMPIVLAVLLGSLIRLIPSKPLPLFAKIPRYSHIVVLIIAFIALSGMSYTYVKLQNYTKQPHYQAMRYVVENLESHNLYLIPPSLDNFRLATGAPIFVDKKTHPYKATEVIDWYSRYMLAKEIFSRDGTANCELLQNTIETNDITHVLVPTDLPMSDCKIGDVAYASATYNVVSVP